MSVEWEYSGGRFWFVVVLGVLTLGLVGLGGVVTSKGVGLAVPDWPNSYGYNMFFFPVSYWVGGVVWEHSHRLFGSLVGLLTLVLAVWLWGGRGGWFLRCWLGPVCFVLGLVLCWFGWGGWGDWLVLWVCGLVFFGLGWFWPCGVGAGGLLRWWGVVLLVGVVLQGVLGGLRVRWLADWVGVVHAGLGQVFFVLVCVLGLLCSRWWLGGLGRRGGLVGGGWLGWFLGVLCGLVFVQLVLGASMRHQHAGLAVEEFPLWVSGRLFPATDEVSLDRLNRERVDYRDFNPVTRGHVFLHMGHRWLGSLIFLCGAGLVWLGCRVWRGHWLVSGLVGWFGLVCLQVVLGAATVWSGKAADIATLHVVLGAVVLALGWVLCMVVFRVTGGVRGFGGVGSVGSVVSLR